ncbi:peroxidasin-like protein isoform X2 [Homarus americanus]|uniref:peroxidasin-like protein isoform X2 n=1 Tax=Homarus americanus TaxID=6706 RepID=UPI001C4568E7|nr:peroxidasin-like protein isoform X2 [Homarus americanus]
MVLCLCVRLWWFCCVVTVTCSYVSNLRPFRGVLQDLGGPQPQPQKADVRGGDALFSQADSSIASNTITRSHSPVPQDVTDALRAGLEIAQQIIDQENANGEQLRTSFVQQPLEQSTMFLFSFRRAEPAAKRAASCQGRLLLEASKNFTRRHNIAAQDAQFFLARLNTMVEAGACKSLRPRGCEEAKAPPQCSPDYPYRSIDGSCNNLQNPRWGAASIPFVRYLAPAYEDGVDALRGAGRTGLRRLPSPRAVSWMLHVGGNRPPLPHLTLMIMQWGQFMDHDIVHTPEAAGVDEHGETMPVECCRDGVDTSNFFDLTQDCRPIDVSTDPLFSANGRTCMRFVRSLIASRDCLLGDERVNEQPALASMHTLWLRVHENLVTQLARLNPHWDDETLYQESRRIVVALIQQTTYREFLPLVLGDNLMQEYDLYPRTRGLYDTYDPSVDSSIANSFGTAAYRFGHTLVNDVLRGSGKNVTLSGSFMDPHVLHESGTSPSDLLSGLANSHSQAADSYLVPTLTNKLFARPDEPVGLDLMALNIQRGRDHGLPPYTVWRKACGLSAVSSFPQLGKVTSPQVAFTLSSLYGSVDDVDLFPAGLAETALSGGLLGPTLSCIIAQQFSNLKKGDRFWYENLNQPKPFAIGQLDSIRQISLTGVMCEHLRLSHLQPRPFLTTEVPGNNPRPCSTYQRLNLRLWREKASIAFPTQPPITQPPITPITRPPITPITPMSQCHGVGVWTRLPGIDQWCSFNCFHSVPFCPPSHCNCSSSHPRPPYL